MHSPLSTSSPPSRRSTAEPEPSSIPDHRAPSASRGVAGGAPLAAALALALIVTLGLGLGGLGGLPQGAGQEPPPGADPPGLMAGTAVIDITPTTLPVLVNGGFTSRSFDRVKTPLKARALVLGAGDERVAVVVVDTCMMPRDLLDEAKAMAAERTGIATDRMLIAATHTHTAPSAMGALGTCPDPVYVPFLRQKLAAAIEAAAATMVPAEVAFARTDAGEFNALRRWILRPDRVTDDPFGNLTVRANMHVARDLDAVTGESGPKDPELGLISVRHRDGRPLAVLANYSMHYYGDEAALSADYFGLFAGELAQRLVGDQDDDQNGADPGGDNGEPAFVAMMSHGCSGDIWRVDYRRPDQVQPTLEQYAAGLADKAAAAMEDLPHRSDVDLAMLEQRVPLAYRVPDRQRLQWAEAIVEEMNGNDPQTREQVYARDQVMLHEAQGTEVVLQALRIGDIALATTPTETYALTALKIKRQSPLEEIMVFDLANGGDGYIPPPEQHVLGGYNTWPARSAGLEVQAEPIMVERLLGMLEQLAGEPRRSMEPAPGPGARALLQLQPAAYWRLDEAAGPRARDASGHGRDAIYEDGVVFYLEGGEDDWWSDDGDNRAAHFAGGRLRARVPLESGDYTVTMRVWNGLAADARNMAGWMLSRGRDHGLTPGTDHLGLIGAGEQAGLLVWQGIDAGGEPVRQVGTTQLERWRWHHVAVVRQGANLTVHVDGEIDLTVADAPIPDRATAAEAIEWFIGGRSDRSDSWQGRLDEVAVFDRALQPEELARLLPPRE